mgnify:CR=1 FL=1
MTLPSTPSTDGRQPSPRKSKRCEYCRAEFTPDAAPHTKYWKTRRFCHTRCANRHRRETATLRAVAPRPSGGDEKELIAYDEGVPVYRVPIEGRTSS